MKKGILLLLIVTAASANAQSLKDALYGGKLKTDSGTVIKKGDDLSTKIDTTRKKPVDQEKTKQAAIKMDSTNKNLTAPSDPATSVTPVDNKAAAKDNNKLWKEFADAVIGVLNTEVLTSKKIKKDDYTVMVDYEIGLDGLITIKNVYLSPENKFLEEQVKERFGIDTPKMNPVMGSNGKPRKVNKRFNFILTKN